MNMTQREDGQWRALKNDELMRNKMHLGDVYKQELALELTKAVKSCVTTAKITRSIWPIFQMNRFALFPAGRSKLKRDSLQWV
ncbi:relaxase domain-containing protein [Raoultella planticola]|uniref:Relaxase domain-containing protein n=1 Tax=Raoultella planticola TaxID=575 RepID=A0A9Q9P1R5_RAOPL|nr:relaxase domain-containing protein [Raoultella planticola]UYA92903.1 relaxase domain-containing protein [Raoultella planticola]